MARMGGVMRAACCDGVALRRAHAAVAHGNPHMPLPVFEHLLASIAKRAQHAEAYQYSILRKHRRTSQADACGEYWSDKSHRGVQQGLRGLDLQSAQDLDFRMRDIRPTTGASRRLV